MKVTKEINWILRGHVEHADVSLISGKVCLSGEGLMDIFWKTCSETDQAFIQHVIWSKNREEVVAG